MSDTLGTIRGQLVLDVKQAIASYTAARNAHVSTVTALQTGAGALAATGAAIAGAGMAMGAGILVAVNAAAEFERKLDYFTAVGGPEAAAKYEEVRQKALELGADTIYSADQIADSFVELAKSGVGAQEIIDGIGEGVAALGAAADIPLDTAANIITAAVATFNLGADAAVDVANKLAGAANASIVDVQDLGVSLKYAGGVASALKIPFGDVNTALAILGVNGIKGSTAGTSLRQVLLGLNGTTAKARTALKELGIITEDGTNKFYNMDGSAKSLAEVFQILQDATAGMSDQQKLATMQQIFATRALPSLIALTKAGAAGFEEMMGEISKTTALAVASERLDNLSGDLEILRGNLDTLAIESGSTVQEFARSVVQGVTDIIQVFLDLSEPIQTAIVWFVAISSALLVVTGFMGMLSGAVLNIIAMAIKLGPVFSLMGGALISVRTAILGLFVLMRANPFGLLITAIAALVGGLIWFFTSTEQGKAIWASFMDIMGAAMAAIGPLLSQFAGILGGVLSTALQAVVPLLAAIGQVLLAILGPILPIITQLLAGLGFAFRDVGTNASGFEGFLDIFTGIVGGILQSLPVIITAVVQLLTLVLQAIVAALPLIITAGLKLFTGLITAVAQIVPGLVQALITLINQVAPMMVTMLPTIIMAALQLFTGIVQALTQIIPIVITALLNLVLQLVLALTTMLPMLVQAAVQLLMGLVEAVPVVVPPLIAAVVGILPTLIATIIGMIPVLITAAIELFMAIVDALPMVIPPLIQALIDLVPVLIVTVLGMIPQLLQAAVELFMALVNALPQIIPPLINALLRIGPQLMNALISMGPKLLDSGVQLFNQIKESLPRIIPALVSAVTSMGSQIIGGLVNGIKDMASRAIDAVSEVVNGAINWAKGLLGIASPSRVFRQFGIFTIQGLIVGMERMQPGLERQIGQVTDTLTDFYNQVGAAKDLDMQVSLASRLGVDANTSLSSSMAKLSDQMKLIAEKETFNIEKLEVNNPEPETTSESLPKSIRKTALMLG